MVEHADLFAPKGSGGEFKLHWKHDNTRFSSGERRKTATSVFAASHGLDPHDKGSLNTVETPMRLRHSGAFLDAGDLNMHIQQRDIREYYFAKIGGAELRSSPSFMPGMSNYSSLTLGDERCQRDRSLYGETFPRHLVAEGAENLLLADARRGDGDGDGGRAARAAQYGRARSGYSADKLTAFEGVLREKLMNRMRGGPGQLRRTFKFFDRQGRGGIDFEDFHECLRLLGYAARSEGGLEPEEVVALFSRYDLTCKGYIDYYEFCDHLMGRDFHDQSIGGDMKTLVNLSIKPAPDGAASSAPAAAADEEDGIPDFDEDAENEFFMKRAHVREIFEHVDADADGRITRPEFGALVQGVAGKRLPADRVDGTFELMGPDAGGRVGFEAFFTWFDSVSRMGANYQVLL